MPRSDIQRAALGQFAIALYTCTQQAVAVAVQVFSLQCEFPAREQGAATVINITRQIQIEVRGTGLGYHPADIGERLGVQRDLICNQAGAVGT
ncbi:Uncharacterised protein [Yersinia intermedia]|nr:Uncharacterised protein [Yersinia intermedia]